MDEKLKRAIAAAEMGQKRFAHRLLIEVLKSDPSPEEAERAWLWLATVIDDPERKRQSLEMVLLLNPANEYARARLAEHKAEPRTASEPLFSVTPGTLERSKPVERKKNASVIALPEVPRSGMIRGGIFIAASIFFALLIVFSEYFVRDYGPLPATAESDSVGPQATPRPTRTPTPRKQQARLPEDYTWLSSVECEGIDDYGGRYIRATGSVGNAHKSRALKNVRLRVITYSDLGGRRILGNTDWGYADSDIIFPDSWVSFSISVARQAGVTGCDVIIENADFLD